MKVSVSYVRLSRFTIRWGAELFSYMLVNVLPLDSSIEDKRVKLSLARSIIYRHVSEIR